MSRINVIFKQPDPAAAAVIQLETPSKSKLMLQKTFDFQSNFATFSQGASAKSVGPNAQEAFYKSLTPEEQQLQRTYNLVLGSNDDLGKTLAYLRSLPNVEDAREDLLNVLYFTPNDPLLSSLWAMPKISAPNAWNISQGDGIVVAVCDTGIDPTHPDIAANLWNNGSGQYGYDFSDNDPNPADYHGHGTHVAGTIAALGNNATGVIGVAFKARVMAVKIFPNAYMSVCANAIKYAADHGAKLVNCSWGPATTSPTPVDPTLKAAIDYAYNKGCYCIFAAGNNHIDAATQFPANDAKVITVGSTNSADGISAFSNFGTPVDIAAPGENILSLKMGGGYIAMSGTSMATPHVVGASALLLSLAPSLSFENLRYFLRKSGDPITTPQYIGGVRLNCLKLIAPAIQTYKRQTNVNTPLCRWALQTNGRIARLTWNGTTWVQGTISPWGGAVLPGSMIAFENSRLAAVNVAGNIVNTYGSSIAPSYAPIFESFGIVPGTLRYSTVRQAFFALNVFNDFVYMKWNGSRWIMDVIPNWAGPIGASSVELTTSGDQISGITLSGTMCHTWGDPSGMVLSDGSKISFATLGTGSLVP